MAVRMVLGFILLFLTREKVMINNEIGRTKLNGLVRLDAAFQESAVLTCETRIFLSVIHLFRTSIILVE